MPCERGVKYFRNMCTRNCYDTCSILTQVKNGRIAKVSGDSMNEITGNKLCSKGVQGAVDVYSKQRILHPMMQSGRGSGKWRRVTWDDAITVIAEKILSLKKKYGTTLPLCLNKYSGNFGILHYAAEGMFNSLGPVTQTVGTPCLSAGLDGQRIDFGGNVTSDLSDMANSRMVILWGVNPAWTAIHAMPYIYKVQASGGKIVVIDPVFTETAQKADIYIQVKMGEDASFALALLKVLQRKKQFISMEKLAERSAGSQEFCRGLEELDENTLLERCEQTSETVEMLADMMREGPVHIWCGFGLQRHIWGGYTIRIIDSMSMLTGNVGISGGGVNYAQMDRLDFSGKIVQKRKDNRHININNFVSALRELKEPPVKLLWVASRNLLMQDVRQLELQKAWSDIEMVVTADKFLTLTAKMSDIFLPVTTEYEELDVFYGYFNHWVGVNQQAVPPLGEAKSDIEIARLLCRKLNEISPGSSSFPVDKTDEEFLDDEFTPEVCSQLGIDNWRDLHRGPRRIKQSTIAWQGDRFETDDGKFHFCKIDKIRTGLCSSKKYPFHLVTPHAQQSINSQFHPDVDSGEIPIVWMNSKAAGEMGLKMGQVARLYNSVGEISVQIRLSDLVSRDLIICYQGENKPAISINQLNIGIATDMGDLSTGAAGVATYDVLVNIKALKE